MPKRNMVLLHLQLEVGKWKKKKLCTKEQIEEILNEINADVSSGTLKMNAIKKAVDKYGVGLRTIQEWQKNQKAL